MNFFGHAVVAALDDDDPAFVLGSMLPDLLAMVGLDEELLRAPSPRLRAGVIHHHRVDGLFHDAAPFRVLLRTEVGRLRAAGMSRGPAAAAAHVGIELLLDGELASNAPGRAAYSAALDRASDELSWLSPAAAATWAMLVQRLRQGTLPDGYRDLDFVCRRVDGVLSRRPRLALSEVEQSLLSVALPAMHERVSAAAGPLLDAVRAPQPAAL